ncbi:MAG: pyridoxal-5'-phosphate-dependent protein subunit beta [Acidimicrobiales bacterium]|nr:MAG: pyridoxal-5'-phosphate-dependent protein subunit beta [Acidimicrobiales bacterium]
MTGLAIFGDFADDGRAAYDNAITRFRENNIVLPTFAQLRDPSTIPTAITDSLADVDKNAADPRNLFRVHWYNALDGSGPIGVPDHVELPPELTGVDARIVLAFGNRFPMIGAHKVLAAYACLVARLVTGRFDPTADRAIWPSTGNYARGGIAISKIMGCRGVAVLPEGMSRERFEWLDRWIDHPDDVIRTPGTEANVKEIYDECMRLEQDPANVILNQFSEFSNHMGHYGVTGPSLERVFEHVTADRPGNLAAFVSASGSAGTLGAGDYLKDQHGARIVAVEALEVPTMLYNGFGDHNIQGIGDKHIPLIHNVTNTDLIVGVSDESTDQLDVLFNTPAGMRLLEQRGVDPALASVLTHMGYSSICNALAAITTAKQWGLGSDDVIVTVATDGSEMYNSEREKVMSTHFSGGFDDAEAGAVFDEHLGNVETTHAIEMDEVHRNRVFNLGYFTWVEQLGVEIADFEARRDQSFWQGLRPLVDTWDEMIVDFNAATGAAHG